MTERPDPAGHRPSQHRAGRTSTRYVVQRVRRGQDNRLQAVIALLLIVPVVFGLSMVGVAIRRYAVAPPPPTPFIFAGIDEDPHIVPPTPTPLPTLNSGEATRLAPIATPTNQPIPLTLALPTINAALMMPTLTPAIVPVGTPDIRPARAELDMAQSPIVYVCYVGGFDEICVINADGSGQRQITDYRTTSFYPSLSPDGAQVAFASLRDGSDFEIYVINIDGSGLRQLTDNSHDDYAPDFSPDGSRIVYVSTINGDQDIYVMSANGSGPVRITYDRREDLDPTWSPDGSQISFASTRSGTKELFVMNADGSGVRQITFHASIGGRNDWSPDGRFLTYYAGPQGDKNIYLVSAACAAPAAPPDCYVPPIRLTDGGNNKGPSFSPDGEWVAFAANRGSDNDIYVIRLDGTNLRRLTTSSFADWQPRWQP